MNVTFVTHNGGAPGGAEDSLFLLLKNLPSDIRPNVVVFEDGIFAGRLRSLGIAVALFGVPPSISTSTRERPNPKAILDSGRIVPRLAAFLRKSKPDVVFTNSMKSHVVAALAARIAGIPTVMYLHDILRGKARAILRPISALCTAERLVCSAATGRALSLSSTTVLYGPIDLTTFQNLPDQAEARKTLGIPSDGLLYANIGRINRWKGQDRFIRAAAIVAHAVPTARFAIVGAPIFRDADFVPELERLVESCGLSDRLTFVPWLDDPRVSYRAADVHVSAAQAEPFGRTAVEAAACGRPTVCFDDGGTPEAIENGRSGYAVPALDERRLAEAMIRYAIEPETLRAAQHAAHENARRFDINALETVFVEVLRRAVQRSRRPISA